MTRPFSQAFEGVLPLGKRSAKIKVTCTVELPDDLTDFEREELRKFGIADALAALEPIASPRAKAVLDALRSMPEVATVGHYLRDTEKPPPRRRRGKKP